MTRELALILALVSPALGESNAVRQYVRGIALATADDLDIEELMPFQKQASFAQRYRCPKQR